MLDMNWSRTGRTFYPGFFALAISVLPDVAGGAEVVPPTVQMPGTQPGEVGGFQAVTNCDNCHAGYDPAASRSISGMAA